MGIVGLYVRIGVLEPPKDERMKTRELLAAPEADLAPKLKVMKLKELERHIGKVLKIYGVNSADSTAYDALMAAVIKTVPQLKQGQGENFVIVQDVVKEYLLLAANDSAEDQNFIERLTAMVMVVISKKFQKILQEQS